MLRCSPVKRSLAETFDRTTARSIGLVEQCLSAYLENDLGQGPPFVSVVEHHRSDIETNIMHLANLEGGRELDRFDGRNFDPLRFRDSIYVDQFPPRGKLACLDRELASTGVRIRVIVRANRCDTSRMEPSSGNRDRPSLTS